jgi:hypothetical protein
VLSARGVCSVCSRRGGDEVAVGVRRLDEAMDAAGAGDAARLRGSAASAPANIDENDTHNHDDTGFEDRALCPSGTCIGVLGPDGVCKTCGARESR